MLNHRTPMFATKYQVLYTFYSCLYDRASLMISSDRRIRFEVEERSPLEYTLSDQYNQAALIIIVSSCDIGTPPLAPKRFCCLLPCRFLKNVLWQVYPSSWTHCQVSLRTNILLGRLRGVLAGFSRLRLKVCSLHSSWPLQLWVLNRTGRVFPPFGLHSMP